jgi:hypothetical protein
MCPVQTVTHVSGRSLLFEIMLGLVAGVTKRVHRRPGGLLFSGRYVCRTDLAVLLDFCVVMDQ